MRFKTFLLQESPLDAGDVKHIANRYAKNNMVLWKDSPIVKQYEHITVRKFNNTYSMWIDNVCVFSARVLKMDDGQYEVDNLWTDEQYKGKGYLTTFLNFVFSELHANVVLLGNKHSDDTKNILKSNGLSSFKKFWHNSRTGQQDKFISSEIDKYYPKSSWVLALTK